MIYFIRSPKGRIKIGTTIRLSQRLRELAAEQGEDLEVVAVVDGSFAEEKALHRRFAHLRVVREWFEPGDDLLGFIVSDGKPWDGVDEVPKPVSTGTMIRVTDEVAEALRKACALEDCTAAEFSERYYLPIIQKRYRELIVAESKLIGSEE